MIDCYYCIYGVGTHTGCLATTELVNEIGDCFDNAIHTVFGHTFRNDKAIFL